MVKHKSLPSKTTIFRHWKKWLVERGIDVTEPCCWACIRPVHYADSEGVDISGEDVFDLGGPAETTEFTPAFDLDEPEAGPASATFDFDIAGDQAPAPADPGAAPMDQPYPADVQDAYAAPATSVPVHDIRWSVINAIAPVLIELATEIRRSLDYYATRYQSHPEVIYLCGGTARMRNLDQFLANELGIPVQVADPMANIPVQCPRFTPDYLRDISPLFPVSIGLAMREMLE
jgi:Tfp pilus assembly PilM family ATPase